MNKWIVAVIGKEKSAQWVEERGMQLHWVYGGRNDDAG